MPTFLQAHGLDPGPTQRPYLTGALSGLLATAPAIALLHVFGSLEVEARILGLSVLATLGLGWAATAAAGALYARLFGRAANGRRGGWLFGMAFGFALWAAGAVMVLPLLSGGKAPAGQAAMGVFLSLLAWGLALGILVARLDRLLRRAVDEGTRLRQIGPAVASSSKPGPRSRSSSRKR